MRCCYLRCPVASGAKSPLWQVDGQKKVKDAMREVNRLQNELSALEIDASAGAAEQVQRVGSHILAYDIRFSASHSQPCQHMKPSQLRSWSYFNP